MICQACGMEVEPDQYHPFEYCILYRAGINPDDFVVHEINRYLDAKKIFSCTVKYSETLFILCVDIEAHYILDRSVTILHNSVNSFGVMPLVNKIKQIFNWDKDLYNYHLRNRISDLLA